MSQVPRASPTNLEQTARSVNVLRDLLQRHLRTPDAMPSVSTGLTEAQVQAMIRRALEQFEIQQDVFPVLQLANATYGGSQFFYTSHDDGTGAGYVANRFYIDAEEEAHEDTLTGSGSPPVTRIEFQALAWPTPVP